MQILRLGALSGLLVTFMLSTVGCVVVPTPETGSISKERAQAIIGVPVGTADKLLHENKLELTVQIDTGETKYHVYRGNRTSGVFIMAFFPLLAFEESRRAVGTQCLLLEVQDDTVVRGSLKSTDDVRANCPRLFWTDEEYSKIAEQWFATLTADGGNREAAFELARRFEEPMFIRVLAEQGDRDAAFELARQYDEPMFIRALAEQGDRDAAFELARQYDEPMFIRALAEQGDRDAAFELARRYEEPMVIRALAEQGHRDAAFEMARRYGDPTFLRRLAADGDLQAGSTLERRFFEPEPLRKLLEQRKAAE